MTATVKQLLKGTPITVREDDDLALALQVMVWGDVRHLPVVGGDALVGVLRAHDQGEERRGPGPSGPARRVQ